VKRVRGERGGVTTASSLLAMDFSELGSADCEDCANNQNVLNVLNVLLSVLERNMVGI
jgi:hypothetical protein